MKKANKQPKKISDSVALELRRLGVVMEHMDGKISLVAEQYGDVKKDTRGIKQEIHGVKQALNMHTDMIGKLAVDLTIVKEDIALIKGTLKKKVDYDEFATLERRVSILEKRR